MRQLTGWWGGNAVCFFAFFLDDKHKNKQTTNQTRARARARQDEREDSRKRTKPTITNEGQYALAPFLTPTMREGARAHEIDDTAASKIDSAATKT